MSYINNRKVSKALLEEMSKCDDKTFDNESLSDLLAVSREVIDIDFLESKGETSALTSIVSDPACVIYYLVRSIELLQNKKEM